MEDGRFSLTLTGDEGYGFTVRFDDEDLSPIRMDEPEPLGEGEGPNATRLLAAAVGHCLSASLLFCLRKARVEPHEVRTVVEGRIVRNDRGRLRIEGLTVRLHPTVTAGDRARMGRCLDLFEDFCIVTESVRGGIDVDVKVEPREATIEDGELAEIG